MVVTKFKHGCGCVTERDGKKIKFIKTCERHSDDGKAFCKAVWIALQHPN